MREGWIRVRGARTHNLQDVDVDIPRGAWTVVCGVSGSGKSSLVLDTLGAESRRRLFGTLPGAWRAREDVERPDVDAIEGLPPAVSTGFQARRPGPRETLGTLTEVTHALRALFARIATPHCPTCLDPVQAVGREVVTARLLDLPVGTRLVLLAPCGQGPAALEEARESGFVRVRLAGGPILRVEDHQGAPGPEDTVEVVVDRLVVRSDAAERFAASVEQGLEIGRGVLSVSIESTATLPEGLARETTFADRPYCPRCRVTWPRLSPASLSFDRPAGACPRCEGRGVIEVLDPERALPRRLRWTRVRTHLARALDPPGRRVLETWIADLARRERLGADARVSDLPESVRRRLLEGGSRRTGLVALLEKTDRWSRFAGHRTCPACRGARLGPFARASRLAGTTLPELERQTVRELAAWLAALPLEGAQGALARPARDDALARLTFLEEVGLGYLAPARAAATLSGGEMRRARLAAACAARMSGLLFLLDEPTAGLHPAERSELRRRLRRLVEEGNTLICVEHDPEVLRDADHVVELGPGAGCAGGRIVANGEAARVLAEGTAPTVRALATGISVPPLASRRSAGEIRLRGARRHNLRRVDVRFPHEALSVVVGPSGSGKSTLVLEVLRPAAEALLGRGPFPNERLDALDGLDPIVRLGVARASAPRHPRATPGSVLGVLPPLRALFASTLEARVRGWSPSRFSRHVRGGRCEACRGRGELEVGLRDLGPVRVACDACDGTGFAPQTLRVRVKGLSIADVHRLPLEQAATIFRDLPTVAGPLAAATDVGLGYVPLGEATSRLSGGEALRLRLASALGRGGSTPTLYLLDEPSAGLHPLDVEHLATVLSRLGASGHAVVIVDHHPTLLCRADHVVELGPGAGEAGGRRIYEGPPTGLWDVADSPTGAWLRSRG